MKLLAALVIILINLNLSYAWAPDLVTKWKATSSEYGTHLSEASFATFWGGLRRVMHWRSHRGDLVSIKPPGFIKDLPIYLHVNSGKRDLYIFYPGVFGLPDGRINHKVIDALENKEGHVAVIPNLVSPTYLVARTPHNKFNSDSLNQQIIINEILLKIKKENIDKIHVYAESLGSYQALNAFSQDTDQFKFDSLTLMWPPLHLDRAISRLDLLIKKSISLQKECPYWWIWPFALYETKFKPVPYDLTSSQKKCMGAWMIEDGFVKSIRETSEIYLSDKGIKTDIIPSTFNEFIKLVVPEINEMIVSQDLSLSLSYFLNKLKGKGNKIRIVTSENDFLNLPQEWQTLRAQHPELDSQIFLFSWGGHSGPMGMEGFIESIIENKTTGN